MQALRAILSSLDIPELEPVPRDHVLTKTFYLLKEFPGRFGSGQLWVEASPAAASCSANERARSWWRPPIPPRAFAIAQRTSEAQIHEAPRL